MLTSRLRVPSPSDPEAEDIFQSSLATLFTDDVQNSHGSPGGTLVYESPLYGDIGIQVPDHPNAEDRRQLFAHYIWNAGVLMADLIESASCDGTKSTDGPHVDSRQPKGRSPWNVRGEKVIELGAGTALPSTIAILSSASEVCVTDHPASPALLSGTIQVNIFQGLRIAQERKLTPSSVSIQAHEWGVVTDDFSREKGDHYSKLIISDCLWMGSQHLNLARTIAHFLSRGHPLACTLVVAGFHTGRNVVAAFFKQFLATSTGGTDEAGAPKIAEIYEMDMQGARRAWYEQRSNESREEAKRWCVVAVIVRG